MPRRARPQAVVESYEPARHIGTPGCALQWTAHLNNYIIFIASTIIETVATEPGERSLRSWPELRSPSHSRNRNVDIGVQSGVIYGTFICCDLSLFHDCTRYRLRHNSGQAPLQKEGEDTDSAHPISQFDC
jgi:hypothetical protein